MSKLNELNLTAYERANSNDSKLKRGRKLLAKLIDQQRVAEDDSYQTIELNGLMRKLVSVSALQPHAAAF